MMAVHGFPRSVWDEPGFPHPPPRVWRDWVLVGVLVPIVVLEGVLRPDLPWRVLWVVVTVALVPTVLWRRTRPLLMVVIAFVALGLAAAVTGAPGVRSSAFVLILPYALFRWGSGRDVVLGSAIMLAKVGSSLVLGYFGPADAVTAFAVVFSAAAVGTALRYRAGVRLREFERVKLLERERLARDLHDTVAHHVSAMAIRAQAGLATSTSHPGAATEALRVIEAEASRALAEMRAMVRVLRRDEPADLAPSPRISDLKQLAGSNNAGPSVDVEIDSEVDDVPPPVAAAIYRLAQESVTNARRHARQATRIEVRVTADDASVHLRVSDDGEASGNRPTVSAGFGLAGMMERADLLGGTCTAGPNPGRGWTVTATLPRTAAA